MCHDQLDFHDEQSVPKMTFIKVPSLLCSRILDWRCESLKKFSIHLQRVDSSAFNQCENKFHMRSPPKVDSIRLNIEWNQIDILVKLS